MQLALALDSGSACGVFPGQREVGHAVPTVSAYNFSVCDGKAQLHRDKQADFCVAPLYVASSIHPLCAGLCRYAQLCSKLQQTCADISLTHLLICWLIPHLKSVMYPRALKKLQTLRSLIL